MFVISLNLAHKSFGATLAAGAVAETVLGLGLCLRMSIY